MRRGRRLASRITTSFFLIFILAFASATAVVIFYALVEFESSIDETLDGIADATAERIAVAEDPVAAVSGLTTGANLIEVYAADGTIVARSPALGGVALRDAGDESGGSGRSSRETSVGGEEFRIARRPIALGDGRDAVVFIGVPVPGGGPSPITMAAVGGTTAVVVALLGSAVIFVVATRSARPLRRLSVAARATADSGFREPFVRPESGTREVHEISDAIDELVERQVEQIARERAFFADSSHVLRTPLAVVKGNLEVLEEGATDPEQVRGLARAQRAVEAIARTVSGLLLLSRDQRSDAVEWSVIELHMLLDRLANEARTAFPEMTIEVRVPPELEVAGDEFQLRELFTSLIENACVYSNEDGEVEIVGMGEKPEKVHIEIRDRGIGIPEEEQQAVLQRFFRGSRAQRHFSGGSGLGLAIAQRIAQLHQGSITLRSRSGGGTILRVTLPLLGAE